MKKSAGKLFITGFLKSLLFFALIIGIGTLSFRIVMHFFDIENETADVVEIIPPDREQTHITEASIDDISRHLIFCADDNDGTIKKVVLEIFNCAAHKLYYITIPIKTQFTLSPSLYKELVLIKPSIPQFLQLSAVTAYIPEETAYEYGVLMIEELLDINISYYSVVSQSIYESVFATENIEQANTWKANNEQINTKKINTEPENIDLGNGEQDNISGKAGSDGNTGSENAYPREVFSLEFLEFLHTIKTETQLREYIREIYTGIRSNLSFEDKLNYMDSYLNVTGEDICFDVIAGTDSNSAYTVDEAAAAKQLESCLGE